HWHGFFQPNNSWADSVAMVTQCPIATNRFLYTFPTAGTFWYHSHLCLCSLYSCATFDLILRS
ncbi:hypothetical protein B0H14DRAFT_2361888, partial [Mycena olivaceomarginata]